MLRKMDIAKALTGECAGELIKADKTGLNHRICREWKFYCPECYQFVHWRKSENKGRNCFAHYDVEDKNCKKRVKLSSNNVAVNINSNDSQWQDLKGIQNEFENIIFNYIADSSKIRKDIYKPHLDGSIVQNCIEYYLIIVNDDNILKKRIEVNYTNDNKFYNENSYKIPKAVCKLLSIDMNRAILNKLIRYAIDINNSTNNSRYSNKFIETTVDSVIEIIADIDWTIDKTKSKILEVKNIASNPEFVSQSGLVQGATVYHIPLPIKQKDSIVEIKYNLRVEHQRMKINELLDTRELNFLAIRQSTQEIPVYSVKIDGQVKPLLFQLAMVEERVVLTLKNSKLPAKIDATKFQDKILDIAYSLGLNSFSNIARKQLPFHYAVMHSLLLSQEFLEIPNKTSLEHDKLLTTFEPLPPELVNIYYVFAYRAVEIIQRYRNLRDAANTTKNKLQEYAQARQLDLNSYLDIVHEKMAVISQIEERFELKDALEKNVRNLSASEQQELSRKSNIFINVPLFAKQQITSSSIVAVLRPATDLNNLAYIEWTDTRTKNEFQQFAVLKVEKVFKGERIVKCTANKTNLEAADNHTCCDGKRALYYLTTLLENWGLVVNDSGENRFTALAELAIAKNLVNSCEDRELKEYLIKKINLEEKSNFVPIWESSEIQVYLNLFFKLRKIEDKHYICLIKDNRFEQELID
jgi:dephospho-CoA kinase